MEAGRFDDGETQEGRRELCASRWLAISIPAGATKTGVDYGGLLMEVADKPYSIRPTHLKMRILLGIC
jgi:hypothetical protein